MAVRGGSPTHTLRSPQVWLTLSGFLASAVVVVGGGRVGPVTGATFPSSWLGVLARNHVRPNLTPFPGLLLVCGIAMLVAVWLVTLRIATRAQWSLNQLWLTIGVWMTPLALGPPLLSGDVYSYAAQGYLAQSGSDPYTSTPNKLSPILAAAVDPSWRSAHSPYGPLATALERLAVFAGGGSAFGGVLLLRALAVVSVLVIGWGATRLTTPARGPVVLLLTAANPLVLLHFVSGAHIDGAMMALVVLALLAERRGHLSTALALGCSAGMIKVPGFLVVGVILLSAWHNVRVNRGPTLLRAVAVTVGSCAVLTLLVPHGWGWISSWNTPGQGNTPGAPAAMLGAAFRPLVDVASYDDLMAGGRITMLSIGAVAIIWFLATSQHRPIPSTTGWCLLVFSVINPVLYPWYLAWGIVCLAVDARRWRRDWLIALSVWGTTLNVPGVAGWMAAVIFGVTDLAIALWLVWALRGRPEFWTSFSAALTPGDRRNHGATALGPD
ncbi:alpha-1,6-mannosyltransferase [Frankineae bacterium MT45]|nr:alpha-1,6-mannosyltransferase [Frankineae bacterium MT45]